MNTETYWDESGLLKARKYERDQNMLLRTAYYHLFGGKIDKQVLFVGVDSMTKDFYQTFAQHPYTTYEKDFSSHDELAAVIYSLSLLGAKDNYIKYIKHWRYILYPQVFFFLLACKYKWKWAINAAYMQMNYSTSQFKKSKNGKWDTDGALLALLKIATFQNLSINKPLKDYRVEKNITFNWASKRVFHKTQLNHAKKNLIREMLSEEKDHPLMELVNGL